MSKSPNDNSTATIAVSLWTVLRLLRARYDQQCPSTLLTLAQWQVLRHLALSETPMKQAEMARALNLSPVTVSGAIDRLEAEALLERHPDTTDRRVKLVSCTAKGRRLASESYLAEEQTLAQAVAGIPPQELQEFEDVLLHMRANLQRQFGYAPEDNRQQAVPSERH